MVKQTLLSLLSFATAETLDVMLTDCSESEDQTGIARMNILKFLSNDAADFRREVLAGGRNIAMEELFFDGLVSVLDDTTMQETRIIIDMISSISIIRGTRVDRKRLDRFVRALTTSLKADSSTGTSLPHINTFATITSGRSAKGKDADIDGRSALDFLANHGGAVIDLGLAKKDEASQGIIRALDGWVEGAEKVWREEKESGDKVARGVVESLLDEVLVRLTPPFDVKALWAGNRFIADRRSAGPGISKRRNSTSRRTSWKGSCGQCISWCSR